MSNSRRRATRQRRQEIRRAISAVVQIRLNRGLPLRSNQLATEAGCDVWTVRNYLREHKLEAVRSPLLPRKGSPRKCEAVQREIDAARVPPLPPPRPRGIAAVIHNARRRERRLGRWAAEMDAIMARTPDVGARLARAAIAKPAGIRRSPTDRKHWVVGSHVYASQAAINAVWAEIRGGAA